MEFDGLGKNVTDQYYIVNVLKAQDNVIAFAGRRATFEVTASVNL
jgi:hypothetical protein